MKTVQYMTNIIRICLLPFIVVNLTNVNAQEVTETPTTAEAEYRSFFTNDTCAPPCWFGLVAGESTSQEVLDSLRLLANSGQIVDLMIHPGVEWFQVETETAAITNGSYYFDFGPFERSFCCLGFSSQASIYDGKLNILNVVVREYITMDDVITQLGYPDEFRLSRDDFTATAFADFLVEFIYYDLNIRIGLAGDGHPTESLMCNYSVMRHNYWVDGATYYSPQAAMESVLVPFGESEQQPALYYYIPEQRHIPSEMWDVMMGDDPILCEDLWETLPQEMILPVFWNGEGEAQ